VALVWESVLLPPYAALHRLRGYAAVEQRLQYPRYLKALSQLHAVLQSTPLAGHYVLTGGLLLGWRREGRALPWDCWDIDLEVDEDDIDRLFASLPALRTAGWRHRRSWAHNGGGLAEVRCTRGAIGLDFFITRRVGEELASWVFAKRDGAWLQAEQRVPVGSRKEITFLGLTWQAPDPVEPALRAMYGSWEVADPAWDYMESSSIVSREPWSRPAPPAPWS
jgi:hypothetical protein